MRIHAHMRVYMHTCITSRRVAHPPAGSVHPSVAHGNVHPSLVETGRLGGHPKQVHDGERVEDERQARGRQGPARRRCELRAINASRLERGTAPTLEIRVADGLRAKALRADRALIANVPSARKPRAEIIGTVPAGIRRVVHPTTFLDGKVRGHFDAYIRCTVGRSNVAPVLHAPPWCSIEVTKRLRVLIVGSACGNSVARAIVVCLAVHVGNQIAGQAVCGEVGEAGA